MTGRRFTDSYTNAMASCRMQNAALITRSSSERAINNSSDFALMDFTTGTGRVLNDPREVRLQEAANNVSRKKLFARGGGVFGEIHIH